MRARVCTSCGRTMPREWAKPYCTYCGERVVTASAGHGADGVPYWDGTEDLSAWAKKRFEPAVKLSGREDDDHQYISSRGGAAERLASRAPIALFFGGVASLGISSTIWIVRRALLLSQIVREDERLRVVWFNLWMISHCAAISLLGAYALTHAKIDLLLHLGAFYSIITIMMGRYYLNWIRGVIAEATMISDDPKATFDAIACHPLLMWYLGPAYLQYCINRARRFGVLDRVISEVDEEDEDQGA